MNSSAGRAPSRLMDWAEFQQSIARDPSPPEALAPALLALWHDGRGDWEAAHRAAQSDPSPAGSWVHAFLHRKEGDRGNAGYWYARAGRPMPAAGAPFPAEASAIAQEFLRAPRAGE